MNLWLTYGARETIDDCDSAWDTRAGGDVVCSADTGIKMVGTGSAKQLTTSGIAESQKMASNTVSPGTLAGYTHLLYWVRCTVAKEAGVFQMMLDDTADIASPLETINFENIPVANQWYRHCIPLANPASDTAIISVGVATGGGTFATANSLYLDDINACVAKSFQFYGIRGLYRPDEVMMFPGTRTTLLDGSDYENISAYKRVITLDMAPVTTSADRIFLLNWAKASEKYIVYGSDDVRVVLEDPSTFANEWMGGVEVFPKWTLRCVERSARTTDPTSWGYTL